MRFTVERVLEPALINEFYPQYVAAFDPLRTRAAARHVLTAREFAADLTDERIDKYLAWDGARPVGLATVATDLSAVPWISPEYFAARYPEQAGRGALYYLGFVLVHPEYQGGRAYHGIIKRVVDRIVENRAVCGFDACAYNDAHQIGQTIARVGRRADMRIETLDTQSYHAALSDGPLEPEPAPEPTLDVAEMLAAARTVSLSERPDLVPRIPDVLASRWPPFMLDGTPGHGLNLTELLLSIPRHQLVMLGPDERMLAVGLSIPLTWDGTSAGLPAGWDGAVSAGAELRAAGGAANAVCALSMTVPTEYAGRGVASRMFAELGRAAGRAGAPALLAPVRPVLKPRYPLIPMSDYMAWRTEDGQVFDPWLRFHLRIGGTLMRTASPSMTITGTVTDWRRWTDLPLPDSGEYVIPGGLVPLLVDRVADTGVYREPNVWVVHRTGS